MSFCLGIKIEQGLIGIADTRITTGAEQLSAHKISTHQVGPHSLFVMTSGLRSVRDKALAYFDEALAAQAQPGDKLYKAVNVFAQQLRRVAGEDQKTLAKGGFSFNLHAIVGGQLENDLEPKLYLLYPQGNWVEVTRDSPYYLIGEARHGRFLLDQALRYQTPMELALKVGYLAFEATRKSTVNVDFPLDVALFRQGGGRLVEHRFAQEDLAELSAWWQEQIGQLLLRAPTAWAAPILDR